MFSQYCNRLLLISFQMNLKKLSKSSINRVLNLQKRIKYFRKGLKIKLINWVICETFDWCNLKDRENIFWRHLEMLQLAHFFETYLSMCCFPWSNCVEKFPQNILPKTIICYIRDTEMETILRPQTFQKLFFISQLLWI